MDVLNIISFIIGILGTVLSVVGIIQTQMGNQAVKKANTIDWAQMQTAAKYIKKKIKKQKYPNIVICPGQKGGIFAQLIIDEMGISIPIYTGFIMPKNENHPELEGNYISLDTSKWHVLLPKCIETTTQCQVLIVDDFVMSGDFLLKLKNQLLTYGYKAENINSCSIATTNVAIHTNKAPDLYWKIVEANECYFPWGKGK